LGAIPQNFKELIGLAAGSVPTPLMDTLMALLLARTIMTAASVGIFQALDSRWLTADEIANRCKTDPQATGKLIRALLGCKYLRYKSQRFGLAPHARRWLSPNSPGTLHSAVLHCHLDLRSMNFEEYVRSGSCTHFHSALSSEDWQLYHRGQANYASQMIDDVADGISLPVGATDLLDLGGGHGMYAIAFCRRYHNLRARVLDLAITAQSTEQMASLDDAQGRVKFEAADIRAVPLERDSTDIALLVNVLHHFDESTNRALMQRVALALRPRGIVAVVDAMSPSSLEKTGQLEGLFDLYFGASSGAGLWTIAKVQEWALHAGLAVMPPIPVKRMPFCKIQIARKA
jgi:cyclopropane fatty-acyl-phospholipid synthase-like methyltransferase